MKELHLPKLKMSTVLDEADQKLQITNSYLSGWRDSDMKAEGYCAMGLLACASDSVVQGGVMTNESIFLKEKYKISDIQLKKLYRCPKCDEIEPIISIIIHMNDNHELTYKQIAHYLKKLKL